MSIPRPVPILALILLASGVPHAAEPFRPFEDAAPTLVPRLEALAGWCRESKCLRERASVLEAVLVFAPDHAEARRSLGYRKKSGQGWVRRGAWRPPRTTREEVHEEFSRRWKELAGGFIGSVLGGLAERGRAVTGDRRDAILERLLLLAPDDTAVRAARGEVRDGERWALAETVRARARRAEIRQAAKDLLARRPSASPGTLDAVDRAIGLPWKGVLASESTRVVGTVSLAEMGEAVHLADATADLFRLVLARKTKAGENYTIHLLDGPGGREAYLDRHPELTDRIRQFARGLNSAWSEKIWDVGIWMGDRSWRSELVARQTLVMMAGLGLGIGSAQGALHEGLGLYLTEALVGQRRIWMVKPSLYGERGAEFSARMKDPKSDWFALARGLAAGGETPDYPDLLGRDVNGLRAPDVLHAYVLAAYLLEGSPDGWSEFLEHGRRGIGPDRAAREAMGLSLPALERRVLRWLDERVR